MAPGGLLGSWTCDGGPARDCGGLRDPRDDPRGLGRSEGGNRGDLGEPRAGIRGAAGDYGAL